MGADNTLPARLPRAASSPGPNRPLLETLSSTTTRTITWVNEATKGITNDPQPNACAQPHAPIGGKRSNQTSNANPGSNGRRAIISPLPNAPAFRPWPDQSSRAEIR